MFVFKITFLNTWDSYWETYHNSSRSYWFDYIDWLKDGRVDVFTELNSWHVYFSFFFHCKSVFKCDLSFDIFNAFNHSIDDLQTQVNGLNEQLGWWVPRSVLEIWRNKIIKWVLHCSFSPQVHGFGKSFSKGLVKCIEGTDFSCMKQTISFTILLEINHYVTSSKKYMAYQENAPNIADFVPQEALRTTPGWEKIKPVFFELFEPVKNQRHFFFLDFCNLQ